jgi:hypothetical protein
MKPQIVAFASFKSNSEIWIFAIYLITHVSTQAPIYFSLKFQFFLFSGTLRFVDLEKNKSGRRRMRRKSNLHGSFTTRRTQMKNYKKLEN